MKVMVNILQKRNVNETSPASKPKNVHSMLNQGALFGKLLSKNLDL